MSKSKIATLVIAFMLISACEYHPKEVTDISERFNLSIKDSEKCYAAFHKNTGTVLTWLEKRKGWFFGLFSENCNDLIAQLPTYGNYINLVAAKENNWKVGSPEYERFVVNTRIETLQKEAAERAKVHAEYKKQMESGTHVKAEDFGKRWPFTVSDGHVDCVGRSAVLRTQGMEYGLNGFARSRGYTAIDPVWRDDPEIQGTKINIGEMISLACSSK